MYMYDFSRLRVLIVDDSAPVRRLVRTILRAFGCRDICDVPDGYQAIDMLRRFEFDVVLVDWLMDPIDGIEVTKTIRMGEDIRNPYIPVIMLTGHTTRSSLATAREAGITEYLVKPVTPEGLMARLQAVIEKPRPFVRTATFFGPDRRRSHSGVYYGPERRHDMLHAGGKNTYVLDDTAKDAA